MTLPPSPDAGDGPSRQARRSRRAPRPQQGHFGRLVLLVVCGGLLQMFWSAVSPAAFYFATELLGGAGPDGGIWPLASRSVGIFLGGLTTVMICPPLNPAGRRATRGQRFLHGAASLTLFFALLGIRSILDGRPDLVLANAIYIVPAALLAGLGGTASARFQRMDPLVERRRRQARAAAGGHAAEPLDAGAGD